MGKLGFAKIKITCSAVVFWAAAIGSSAQTVATLTSFDGANGTSPASSLMRGADGNLYGTTSSGGANGDFGTVFKITPAGKLTTLYSFCSQSNCTDGSAPQAGLVQSKNGHLYGTTYYGGTNCVSGTTNSGCGTVFEITPQGKLTTLYSFCAQNSTGTCNDGASPSAALIHGADGNFYGTTLYGGGNAADNNCFCGGFGTIFKISPAGKLTTLYAFCNLTNSNGSCLDGALPWGGVVQAANGTLYGTTYDGGTGLNNKGGTVFDLTPSGKLTTLYSFCHVGTTCLDGGYPYAGLIQATNGKFYGVTRYGGDNQWGTVFAMTATGKLVTLHQFGASGSTEGVTPYSALIQATDGNLYGTTPEGGAFTGTGNSSGTAFKITPNGKFTTLYSFCTQTKCADGSFPYAGLAQGASGDLYGVTLSGGTAGDGTVFSLSLGLDAAETQ